MILTHELWEDVDADTGAVSYSFFPAKNRDEQLLGPMATLIWTVDANSYAEAMSKYYAYMNWGEYKVISVDDWKPYS